MGLTKNMIQLLLSAKVKRNIGFEKMVMIGRQSLHLNEIQLKECLSLFEFDSGKSRQILSEYDAFAEGLMKEIGAATIDSIDASGYEDATIIHDLNNPIPNSYNNNYDLVLDSGTLEHVFNFPAAIKNCMDLTKMGGHFIGIYPCNNFFGHGFYQFSSELFYRVFSEENGFDIIDVVLFVDESKVKYYSVPDSSVEYERITFNNTKPVYIYILAKKIGNVEVFKNNPLQMDYSKLKWHGVRNKKVAIKKKANFKNIWPRYIKNIIKAILNKKPVDDQYYFKKPYFSEYKLK